MTFLLNTPDNKYKLKKMKKLFLVDQAEIIDELEKKFF
jgi:hypothetical protein